MGEEALELGLELVEGGERIPEEAADLLYHLLVLLAVAGHTPEQVAQTLWERRR